jgi:hypothetical protein
MKIQLHRYDLTFILSGVTLTILVLAIFFVSQDKANYLVNGSANSPQAQAKPAQAESAVIGVNKPIEEYTPAERQIYQITESYNSLPYVAAALPQNAAITFGPDLAVMDIQQRHLYQITEEYPFNPVDIAKMDPGERERSQITEYYP